MCPIASQLRLGGVGLATRFSNSLTGYIFDANRKHPLVFPLIFFILIARIITNCFFQRRIILYIFLFLNTTTSFR